MHHRPSESTQTQIQKTSSLLASPSSTQHGFPLHKKPQQEAFSLLLALPSETFLRICTLDPSSLFSLERCCKRLQSQIDDDTVWHRAFLRQFLGVEPENHATALQTLMLKRSEPSWRREFVMRSNVLWRWERSKSQAVINMPHRSFISGMHLVSENGLLAASLQFGTVSRYMPLTGKILPGFFDASDTGGGFGNPAVEFSSDVSTCTMSSEGNNATIVWGFRTGEVAVTATAKAMDSGRVSARTARCKIANRHDGTVRHIFWDPSGKYFVTGALDNVAKVWDVKTVDAVTALGYPLPDTSPNGCVLVTSALTHGILVAGFGNGDIVIRHYPTPARNAQELAASGFSDARVDGTNRGTISSLQIDSNVYGEITVLARYEEHPFFYRIHLNIISGAISETRFGDSSFGFVTALTSVFHPVSSFTLTGDHVGYITIYDWRSQVPKPVHKFEAHTEGMVTAISWSSAVIVSGSTHGIVNIFDSLTFMPLRTFSLLSDISTQSEWQRIVEIQLRNDVLVVSAGAKIMAWKAGPVSKDNKKKGRVVKKTKRAGTAKWHKKIELYNDIHESRKQLEVEEQDRRRVMDREKSQQSMLNNLGLSEQEALEYVMMLSRDEHLEDQENLALRSEDVFDLDELHRSLPSPPLASTSSSPSLNLRDPAPPAISASSSISSRDGSSASSTDGSSYSRSLFASDGFHHQSDQRLESGLEELELDEDAQLQLALDLSLAEARSREDIGAASIIYT